MPLFLLLSVFPSPDHNRPGAPSMARLHRDMGGMNNPPRAKNAGDVAPAVARSRSCLFYVVILTSARISG